MPHILLFAQLVLGAVSVIVPQGQETIDQQRQRRLRLLVPAYFYPAGDGLRHWDRLLAAPAECGAVAIVNPASGPGEKPDPNYRQICERASR